VTIPQYDAVIVGGGHNGLVCAAYLAKAGLNVLVLERRPVVGGACVTEELFPGYRFSSCSYLCYLLQKKVVGELRLREYGFRLHHVDPQELHLFPYEKGLIVWNSIERTQDALGQFSKHDAEAYPRWAAFWERAARLIHPYFLTTAPSLAELSANVRGTVDENFLDVLMTASVKDVVTEFFEHEAVQGAFLRAEDVGDPEAPGGAWCNAYTRCGIMNEVGIVEGGMGRITQAMAASARSHGATVETGVTVQRILVEENRAVGVRLGDGVEIRSRVVVSNADPKRTFLQLIDAEHLPRDFVQKIRRLKTGAAYFKFHAALDRLPNVARYAGGESDIRYLARMRICPSIDYYARSWAEAKQGRPPQRPVIHINISSGYDPTMAPQGKHTMSLLVFYAPAPLAEGTWDRLRDEVGERLIDAIAEYLPDIRDCIAEWMLLTPSDLEERIGFTDGNIRHLDIIPSQYLANRPLNQWADYRTPIEGLYLCGAGTHPGGEVTGAPGHNAAHRILSDRFS
jgi:phytoene dehydrogenase-like protein